MRPQRPSGRFFARRPAIKLAPISIDLEVSCSEPVLRKSSEKRGRQSRRRSRHLLSDMLSSASGDVNLVESRSRRGPACKKLQRPLLVSNGFSTLFLFSILFRTTRPDSSSRTTERHPHRPELAKVSFQHIRALGHRHAGSRGTRVSSGPCWECVDRH